MREAAKINMANIEKTNERTTETMARSRGRRARWRTPGSSAVAQAVSARRERDRPVRQAANAASAGVTENSQCYAKSRGMTVDARREAGAGGGANRKRWWRRRDPAARQSVRVRPSAGRIPSLSPKSRERSLGLNIMKLRNSVAVLPVFFHY